MKSMIVIVSDTLLIYWKTDKIWNLEESEGIDKHFDKTIVKPSVVKILNVLKHIRVVQFVKVADDCSSGGYGKEYGLYNGGAYEANEADSYCHSW
ncbi:hypothetical protein TNCV_2623981 [Trichonephila clavipes]|nr:hypothetical protein TNCV_2623981 [Trichonephila clavipes]